MTRIVPVFCAFLLAGCQQTLVSPPAGLPESALTEGQLDQSDVVLVLGPETLAELKPGTKCTVTLAESTWENTREVQGTVASSSDGVLVLSDAEEITTGRSERGVPAVSNVPYVNRRFKNVGVGVVRKPLGTETISAKQISSVRWTDSQD
jgi:hypothetical protein